MSHRRVALTAILLVGAVAVPAPHPRRAARARGPAAPDLLTDSIPVLDARLVDERRLVVEVSRSRPAAPAPAAEPAARPAAVVRQTSRTAPAPPPTSTGDLPAGLLCIRHRESTDNYRARNGPYSGAYQYDRSTWAGFGGYGEAGAAPPDVQDAKALAGYLEGPANRHHLWPQASRACGL